MKCSECGGEVIKLNKIYVCTKCNKTKSIKEEKVIDMSNLEILME